MAPDGRVLTGFSVEVADEHSSDSQNVTVLVYVCSDINDDGDGPNVVDLMYLVDHLFFSSPPPPIMEAANVDGEGGVNVADLTYLVDYLFFEGPELICGPIE